MTLDDLVYLAVAHIRMVIDMWQCFIATYMAHCELYRLQ